jgi:flagellar motor switch protein FliG
MDLDQLTGTEKVAVLVLSLPEEQTREFLSHLSDTEVERILTAVARFDEIPPRIQDRVLAEFRDAVSRQGQTLSGGRARALELARSALDDARSGPLVERLGREERRIDWTLRAYEPVFVADTLADEHPQVIALVLSQLPAERGAAVIAHLPEAIRPEVVTRVADLETVTVETVSVLEEGVAELFGRRPGAPTRVGGTEAAAKLLNRAPRTDAQAILERVDSSHPDLAGEIRKRMLQFNDLANLDKRAMQTLLREVPVEDLVVALKLASDEMKEKVFGNISTRAADQIREETELLGPMKVVDVEKVQQQIVAVARKLEQDGKLLLDIVGGSQDALV